MHDSELSLKNQRERRRDLMAILFAMTFPTLLTWVYFIWLAHSAAGLQLAAKVILIGVQVGFPMLWVVGIQKLPVSRPRFQRAGLLTGALFGFAVVSVMFAAYHLWLSHDSAFQSGIDPIRGKVKGMGIDSIAKFAAVGVFYAACHSLLEEYYWRWFVFAQLRRVTTLRPAMILSSLGFMAHHVLVLSLFFGWGSFLSLFFSLGVAVGGLVWSWLYEHSRSLYGPWLSHALVDAGIFALGYEILKSQWR